MTSFGRSSSSTNPHRLRKFGIVWYGFPSKLMNASAQFILHLSLQLKPATRMSKFPGTGWGFRDNTCNIQVRQRFLLSLVWFCHIQIYRVRIRSEKNTSTTTTTKKKQDTASKIKTPNPKTESKIKLPKSQTPKSIKIQDPESKLQNRDQKASKRVCPTSVSARPSAQQLRPQRLKHLNPLLPFSLMCCLPNFFLSSKLRCFTWNFGSWLVSPKNQGNFLFFANSPAQWAKCQAGNHPKSVQSLAHKRSVSQKSGTKKNWWEKFRESSA